jgi:long-chain acyl-CoA synthetase
VPDQHSGEAVKLVAVSKSPTLTDVELKRFLTGKLAAYKMPKYIEFRKELPKTNVGKILRRALRDNP